MKGLMYLHSGYLQLSQPGYQVVVTVVSTRLLSSATLLLAGVIFHFHAWLEAGEHPSEQKGAVRASYARTLQLQVTCGTSQIYAREFSIAWCCNAV